MNDRLYNLLPAHLRLRDAEADGTLRALLSILSAQLDRVQTDIDELYDNWFIETCDEWVVPYIGDLLSVGPQYVDTSTTSLRPFVANTLGFRRRKGTAAMLEDLALSVTQWRTRAVEVFRMLATTQHLNHLRLDVPRTPDLRDTGALELLGGPFEHAGRFAEVRRVENRRGKYNISHVALFVWRLASLEARAEEYPGDTPGQRQPVATPDPAAGPGRFRFSQLGADLPLFNPARTLEASARIEEADAPGPLRARALYDELEGVRVGTAAPRYLAADDPAFRIRVAGEAQEIPSRELQICDLSGWTTLPPRKPIPGGGLTRVAVDPVRGRLAFLDPAAPPAAVRVNYHYGFSAELGGGFYDRSRRFSDTTGLAVYTVTATNPAPAADPGLQNAVAQWVADGRPSAVFDLSDSATYAGADLAVPAAHRVVVRARDHQRPTLRLGTAWRLTLAEGAAIELSGLLVSGGVSAGRTIEILTTNPAGAALDHDLRIDDCTLVPGLDLEASAAPRAPAGRSVTVDAASTGRLTVTLRKAIAGRIDLAAPAAGYESVLAIENGIVDGAGGADPALAAGRVTLDRVTVLGATRAETLHASEVVFAGDVRAARTQDGCVRFSYAPPGSIVPRCYRCQPALAIEQAPATDPDDLRARIRPVFTSERYADPGYAQLDQRIAEEIRTGASDGSEMGAFRDLHQPQREANLRTALGEYLRFGLEAGIFFVT
ncbi:MAG TPA: hypothetical protein VFK02_14160 [Kofleriaceae bacterium]|nr:hypothetical protein [Kofleriaceae bacterium]